MIWVYPPPSHPRRQWLWRKIHWRRHRRFQATLRELIEAEMRQAAADIYASNPLFEHISRMTDGPT